MFLIERPPLELHAEVQFPDGSTLDWRSGSDDPGLRPQGISFRTARYDGFKDANLTLNRRIDQPQLDLALFNRFRLIGAGGDVAYEGRIAALPRSTGTPATWSVQAAGLMANAKDRKFAMPFVDRDMGQWQQPLLTRRVAHATGGGTMGQVSVTADVGQLSWALPTTALPDKEADELWYTAPESTNVAKAMYKGARIGAFTSLEAPTLWTNTARSQDATFGTVGLTLDDALRTATPTAAVPAVMLRVYNASGGSVTPSAGWLQTFSKLAVYGDHGLTTRAISGEPDGVYASDVIRWLIENYCPLLNAGGVQDTSYPIGHLAFRDQAFPYDAMLTVNSFHRFGLECWEGGTVYFGPLDLTDYDWELRLDDFGTSLDVNGPVAEEVANGIEVTFTDAATGQTRTLLPDDYEELRDANPLNPVNRAGLYRTTDYALSEPATEDMALQIGRAALAEFNAPKHKGTATKQGYIKDRAGIDQPVWKVRSGDRVLITNSPDEEVHVVVETDYSNDGHTGRFAVDDTFQMLDSYLDRWSSAMVGNA